MPEIRPVEPNELWGRPPAGQVAIWVRFAIVAAAAVTVIVAAIGPRLMWNLEYEGWHWRDHTREPVLPIDAFWYRNAIAIASVVALALVFAWWRYRASRFIYASIALPMLHAGMMLCAWLVFDRWLAPVMPNALAYFPKLETLPIAHLLAGFGAASVIAAFVIARRRQREVMRTLVTLTLAHLFAFGVWLPIAAAIGGTRRLRHDDFDLSTNGTVVILTTAFFIACAVTVFVIRAPQALHRSRSVIAGAIALLVFVAIGLRIDANHQALLFHANFQHVGFVLAFVAAASLLAFAIVTWWAARTPAADWRRGTIVDDGERIVGCVHVPSWLCGPRTMLRGFELETPSGPIPVPSGHLHARMPLWTSVMRAGEAIVVLRANDHARASGFVEAGGEHPFRGSNALVPGPSGVVVAPASEDTPRATHVALVLWRPSVAYLLILVAVALPSLLAALAAR
jgi:hypothetical protein